MQSDLESDWWEDDDPETIELLVGIEGAGVRTHEIPRPFLESEFSDDEARREFIEGQLNSMVLSTSIVWRDDR